MCVCIIFIHFSCSSFHRVSSLDAICSWLMCRIPYELSFINIFTPLYLFLCAGSSTQNSRKSRTSNHADATTTTTNKKRKINLVDDQFRVSSKSVAQQGQLFENLTFCVLESDFVQTLSNSNSGNNGNNSSGGAMVRKFTREDVRICFI